jgi:NADPH-dependent curcumin reductase CurA
MPLLKAQQLLLNRYCSFDKSIVFDGSPKSNFKLITQEYDLNDPNLLKPGELFIQVIYLSNDPAQKGWFTPYKSYRAVTPLGEISPANGIAKVLRSRHPLFKEGDFIETMPGWCDYRVLDAKKEKVHKLDPTMIPLVKYLSAFGGTTMTAYFTVFKYAPQQQGKVWLVTGAAGAAGSSCIQFIANIMRPKLVIGVAGDENKCKWVESLGTNVKCLVYKNANYRQNFHKLMKDDQIDVFVDHVGGWILNHAVLYMRDFGTIVQVGAIAGYNSKSEGFTNYASVITKRLTIKGMIVMDDIPEFSKAYNDLTHWFQEGTLDINNFPEHVVNAIGPDFAKVPLLWELLFEGVNKGKYITQVNSLRALSL